jgi:hypothetical protein
VNVTSYTGVRVGEFSMVGRSLLRDQVALGLQRSHRKHFNVGIYQKLLQKYKYKMPNKPQHCPYTPAPKLYGAKAHAPIPTNISPKLSNNEIKEIQCIIGSILYYARAVDITVLMALSYIASEQTRGTTNTMAKAKELLDYLAAHPDGTIRFQVSGMVLNVHSDAS